VFLCTPGQISSLSKKEKKKKKKEGGITKGGGEREKIKRERGIRSLIIRSDGTFPKQFLAA
jgi:hypothetical protein